MRTPSNSALPQTRGCKRFVPAQRPVGNRLLEILATESCRHQYPRLEHVRLEAGMVIIESEARPSHVYFPEDCAVSLLCSTYDGATAELGMIGNEGALGLALFLGGGSMPGEAMVQTSGRAARVPAQLVKDMFQQCSVFQAQVLRFTQAFITQLVQRSICNRVHSIEQRLCRWLLFAQDLTRRDELNVTQEVIGTMLGARREGVNHAADRLKEAGLIRYTRGRVTILERAGLEARGCEGHGVIRKEYDRLLA